MFCDNCGCEIEDNTKVCPVCGKIFQESAIYDDDDEDSTTVLTSGTGEFMEEDEDGTTVLASVHISDSSQQINNNSSQNVDNFCADRENHVDGSDIIGSEPIKLSNPVTPKTKMSPGAKAALITLPVAAVCAIGILSYIFIPKFINYKKAMDDLDSGNIEEAVSEFTDLGHFRKAEDMASGGAYYQYAEDVYDDADYKTAAEYFTKAAGYSYKDASEKASDSYYIYGNEQLSEGNYDDAAAAFANAGSYSDAADKVKESYYEKGKALFDESNYDGAITAFTSAGNYSDAEDMIGQAYYKKGEEKEAEQEYLDAYDCFNKSQYDDYEKRANYSLYYYANDSYKDGNYSLALSNYKKIDTAYIDVSKAIDNCYIGMAKQAEGENSYAQAVSYYEEVTGTDVSTAINADKIKYVDSHFDSSDDLTMEYLCDLKYAGNSYGQSKYQELAGWTINSFVNSSPDDYDTRENVADSSSTIYVHTRYFNDSEYTLNLTAYIMYADGTKSNDVELGEIKTASASWLSILPSEADAGVATLYIYDVNSKKLVEKYSFTIK